MYFHRVSSRHWPSPLTHKDAARITQGLLLTSSPMAKSQKKPGGLRPKIAIAMAHPCRASFGSLPLASLSATSLASPLFETPNLSFEGRVRNVASYSTDLDRPRQTSTELDAQAHGVRLDRLDRQGLDSTSTAPRRSLDSSTARQPGLNASSARSRRTAARGTIARRRRVAADGDARGGVCGLCACAPVRTSGRSGACGSTRNSRSNTSFNGNGGARAPGSALKMKDATPPSRFSF